MKKFYMSAMGVLLSALTACASTQNYDDYLETWIGRSEADLVATWGAPLQMQNLGAGRQLFVYMRQKEVLTPGVNPQNPNFTAVSLYKPAGSVMESETLYYCETTFTTENDVIIDYSWAGDACVK